MNRRTLVAALCLAPGLAPGSAWAAGAAKTVNLYQRFPALAVGVALPGGRRGVMTVEAGVECEDVKLAERVAQLQPRLRDAWFTALQRSAAGLRPGAPPDADGIARTLQAETDRVLGRKGAAFLMGSILVH
jgi:hypothetical protein